MSLLGEPVGCEKFRSKLQSALDIAGNPMTLEDVYAFALIGFMQLWISDNAIMVTEVICYPRKKVIRVFLGAGDLKELLSELAPKATEWAKKQGCVGAEIAGRPGWSRVMRRYGWSHMFTMVSRAF